MRSNVIALASVTDRPRAGSVPSVTSVDILPCQEEDPHLWFSDRPAELEMAKAHCRRCRMRGPCLAGALDRAEPWGVWGGEILERGVTIAEATRGRPPTRVR